MILYLEQYAIQRKPIKAWIENKPDKNPLDLISEISIHTRCPIILVCYFVEELIGPSEELTLRIGRLKEFYGVDDVK